MAAVATQHKQHHFIFMANAFSQGINEVEYKFLAKLLQRFLVFLEEKKKKIRRNISPGTWKSEMQLHHHTKIVRYLIWI